VHLNRISQYANDEPMEAFNAVTGSFEPGAFRARILLTDRFLSNFNKPLRRRMLFSAPGTVFPASRTFRHPGTQDVYIIGQSRSDTLAGKDYNQLSVCHLVTDLDDGSAGLAKLFRRAPVGPAGDPGWLIEEKVTDLFLDLEFRTSANEQESYELKIGNFFGFVSASHRLEEWDFLELHGNRFRVVDVFPDSGMLGLRVDKEPDTRANFTLHVDGARTYNQTTHEFESSKTQWNVTGVAVRDKEFSGWKTATEAYIDIVIDVKNIGFRPEPEVTHIEFGGHKRLVKEVSTQAGERQYLLRCL